MSEKSEDFFEVDRNRLVVIGGSTYILLPKFLRRGIIPEVTADKYEAVYFRRPNSDQTMIKIERIEVPQ